MARSKNFITISLFGIVRICTTFHTDFFICLHTKFNVSGFSSWSINLAKAQATISFISTNSICINRSSELEDVENDESRDSCRDERQTG
jgi:hypothetical protein